MEVLEIIPKHLYKIPTTFATKLFISFEQTYDSIFNFLLKEGVNKYDLDKYIIEGDKDKHIQGRTTLFVEDDVVLIKMDYFDNSIRSISILQHEIIHAAKKILYSYENYNQRYVKDREEAECYLSEYIFEQIMSHMKTIINYTEQYRNMDWFYEITHSLKN